MLNRIEMRVNANDLMLQEQNARFDAIELMLQERNERWAGAETNEDEAYAETNEAHAETNEAQLSNSGSTATTDRDVVVVGGRYSISTPRSRDGSGHSLQ